MQNFPDKTFGLFLNDIFYGKIAVAVGRLIAAAFLLYSMFSESTKGADYMIGYFLSSIRSRCGFTPDMMAAAMGMRRDEYDRLEREQRVATRDERALLESMCANLRIAV